MGLTGAMVTEHDGWQKYDFEQFAKEQDLVMVRALEVYTPLGHVITMGLEGHISGYAEDLETIRILRKEAAHPVFKLVDEIEVVNGGNIEVENRFAQEVAAVLGRWGTGGSDAHSTDGLAKGTTVFNGDVRNEADLLEALRAGDFAPVEGFHVGKPANYGRSSWLRPSMLENAGG